MIRENRILLMIYVASAVAVIGLILNARKNKELQSRWLTSVLLVSAFIPIVNTAIFATWIFRTFGDA